MVNWTQMVSAPIKVAAIDSGATCYMHAGDQLVMFSAPITAVAVDSGASWYTCIQVTNWSGACYIFPLLGAYIADSHLGRYNTIIVFSIIYILVSLGQAEGPPDCHVIAPLILGLHAAIPRSLICRFSI